MKTRITAALAGALLVAAAAALWSGCGGETSPPDPMTKYVCDSCGNEAKARLDQGGGDCPKCEKGQMAQRKYFRCNKCKNVFEAYQENLKPADERAAPKRAEADADGPLPHGMTPDEVGKLIRRPGGKWAWPISDRGKAIRTQLECPKCKAKGEPREEFTPVLDPDTK
jgi:hypothetical protein